MSTEHQRYSTENQSDAIKRYADERGYQIIKTYSDAGKSGLRIQGRAGLTQLIEDIEGGQADFRTVLVYDVSRWGRCHEMNQLAHYGGLCQRHGKQLIFTASPPAPDDPLYAQHRQFERCQAALYSRYLSNLMFDFKHNR